MDNFQTEQINNMPTFATKIIYIYIYDIYIYEKVKRREEVRGTHKGRGRMSYQRNYTRGRRLGTNYNYFLNLPLTHHSFNGIFSHHLPSDLSFPGVQHFSIYQQVLHCLKNNPNIIILPDTHRENSQGSR